MNAIDMVLKAGDLVAVLTREVSLRLLNISGSGCLLESDTRVQQGLAGTLRVMFEGVEFLDDVRIIRCTAQEGTAAYHVGAEFLWTTTPGERSLRRALARVEPAAFKRGIGGRADQM